MSVLLWTRRNLHERLLCSHQLIIIRGTVLVVAFVSYDTCESFFNQLFCYVTVDGSKKVPIKSSFHTDAFWLPTRTVADSRSSYSPSRGRTKSTWTLTCFPISFFRRNSRASCA